MPPEAPAFRISSPDECEAFFSGELTINADDALPVTADTWLTVHQGKLAAHSNPNANLAWWLNVHTLTDAPGSTHRALIFVTQTLPCFAGHFPGQPILPGVIQLQWALDLAAKLWPESMALKNFRGTARLKFKAPITPGEVIALDLEPSLTCGSSTTATTLHFELRSKSATLTSGRLIYCD